MRKLKTILKQETQNREISKEQQKEIDEIFSRLLNIVAPPPGGIKRKDKKNFKRIRKLSFDFLRLGVRKILASEKVKLSLAA